MGRPSPLRPAGPLLSLLLPLVLLLLTFHPAAVLGQAQVGLCYITYSNVIDLGATPTSWASVASLVLTLNTSTPLGSASFPRAASVTAVTGTRITASRDGLGTVTSSVPVTLLPTSACSAYNGCDNVFYYPPVGTASDVFDGLGLALQLGGIQTDSDQCITSTVTLKSGNISYCDGGASASVYNTLQLYPNTASFPCQPPQVTVPSYYCGIGAYNFTALASLPDISGVFGGYTMYVRLCGAVSQPDCVRLYGSNVQICQWAGPGSAYVEAINNSPTGEVRFSYANGVNGAAGINFTINDGQFCAVANNNTGAPRNSTGTIVCGATNVVTSYYESPTCVYNFVIQTPLACPATQNFAFCQINTLNTNPRIVGYNNWVSTISGVLTAQQVIPTSLNSAVNFYSAATYVATGLVGGTIQWSTLGLNPSAPNNSLGVIRQTANAWLLPPGAFAGNDNVIFYSSGPIPYLGTDNGGASFGWSVGSTQYAGNLYSSTNYGDNYTLGAGYYSTVTYTILPTGVTTAPACVPPSYATQAVAAGAASQTFGFCYLGYASNIFDEYTTSVYWASTITGTLTATPTSVAGQYQVTYASGQRVATSNDGTYNVAAITNVYLNPSRTSYVYYNSPLYLNGTATDPSGLALNLVYTQQDPTGCLGNNILIQGRTLVCANGVTTSSVQNSLTVVPGTTPPPCSAITYPVQQYQCGIGPYDFSSLRNGPDLTVTMNGYTIYFRPCGAVSQVDCVNNFGLNNMVCQWGSSTNLYEISSNLSPAGSPQFSYINGYDAGAGLQMIVQDGQSCNGQLLYPRQVNVTILCGASTQLLQYYEGVTCHYFLTLQTPLACPTPAPIVTSPYCGIGNYNFSLLAYSADVSTQFLGQSIWVRLCGAVRQRDCVNAYGYNMMVCQHGNGGGIYPIATTNPNTNGGGLLWYYINGDATGNSGIGLNMSTGASCGGTIGNRQAVFTLTCGSTSQLLTFAEVVECTYVMSMTTPFACSPGVGTGGGALVQSPTSTSQTFGFCIQSFSSAVLPGYTIWTSSLQGTMSASTVNAPVWTVQSITGTRTVANPNLSGTVGSTVNIVGLESTSNCFGGCDNLIYYALDNPTVVYLDPRGITFDLAAQQIDPSGCIGSSININWGATQCSNTTGVSASGSLIQTTSTFAIQLVPLINGATAPACGVPAVTSTPTLSLPAKPQCGVGSFDFSSLANGPDLSVNMNGYTIYARLCGSVVQPDCVRAFGNNVQFCQWGSSTNLYEMAANVAPGGETTFTYTNGANGNAGITYAIKDGQTCSLNGVTIPRQVAGTITCGAVNALTYYNELSNVYNNGSFICQYIVNITSPLACLPSNSYAMCQTTYSNVISQYNVQTAWSTIVSATFTVSATLPGSSPSAVVTAFNGTRSVASSDGLGRVVSSTSVTLGGCPNCDNLFYWPPPASGTGPFDQSGLGVTLATTQADSGGCITNHLIWKEYGSVVCDNLIEFASNGGVGTGLQIYPITSGYTPPVCVPPTTVVPTYNCSIGPYDFSPLKSLPDIYGAFGGYTLYMRVCGAVSQPDCVRLYGQNVQVCQWYSSTTAYVEAVANSPQGEMTWNYVNGVNGSAGIQFVINDGGYCSAKSPPGPRSTVGTITCGTSNAITSYNEGPTCVYNFGITSPLACPRTQTFGFCMISSNGPALGVNNWVTVASGVLTTSFVIAASQNAAVNLYQTPTYVVTGLTGTISVNTATGAVSNVPITLAPVNAYNGNDNWVYYQGGTNLLWTTGNGLAWTYGNVVGKVYGLNTYADNSTVSGGSYAKMIYTLGATSAPPCATPSAGGSPAAAVGTQVSFAFCYISYSALIFGEYSSTVYWSSVTTGSLATTQTSSPGKYQVTAVSAQRQTTTNDASYNVASTSFVSLFPGYASYVYYNSPLTANFSSLDAAGVALQVSPSQTDPTGCATSTSTPLFLQPGNQQCPNINTSTIYDSFTLAPPSNSFTCNPLTFTTQPYVCGIGPYSFTSLRYGNDLNVSLNGYTIFFRLCGAVVQPDCVAKFGQNSMICQWGSSTNLYEISANLSPYGAPQFSYINGMDASQGITMVVEDGQQCNSNTLYPRTSNVTILCGAQNQLVNYYESGTCHYYLTVLTPLVCPAPPPVEIGTAYCGIGNYNFTLLAFSDDVVGEFVGQSIWVRLCGAVRQSTCVASFGYTTQVCQYQNGGGTYSLASASTVAGQVVFGYANGVDGSAGITFSISNGQVCSGIGPRKSVGYLVCGSSNSILSFFESPTCTYNMNITTPLACNGGIGSGSYSLVSASASAYQRFGFCVITYANYLPGVTVWASLATGTFVAQSSAAPVYNIRSITGYRLTAADATGNVGTNQSITGLARGSANNIAYYTPNAGSTVYFDGSGMGFTVAATQTDLAGCTGPSFTVNYYSLACSGGGVTSTGYSVTVVPLVAGQAGISCAPPAQTPVQLQPPPTCGVGGVSFAPLATYGDLSIVANGYTVYARLCGAVSQPDCVRSFGNNVQFCQWASVYSQYEMASTLSTVATGGETTFGYLNGVDGSQGYTYFVRDGQTCSLNNVVFPRSVQGNISCGSANRLMSYYELSSPGVPGYNSSLICHYVVDMQSPLACPGGGGGGSSGLSGGAIAGIVIGSVVGASILVCILMVFACGVCTGGAGKKSTSNPKATEGVEQSGKFHPQEESQTAPSQVNTEDEVEMATA